MLWFSQRKGLKAARSAFQIGSIDSALRNKLWNVFLAFVWKRANTEAYLYRLWHRYLKKPVDTIPASPTRQYEWLREYFFSCKWYEVFDFVEFTAEYLTTSNYGSWRKDFLEAVNQCLKEEMAGYRIIDGIVVETTSDEEVAEVEQALRVPGPLEPVKVHLQRALELMADRESPDYRNSVKESISAVEAACRLITGQKGATLGETIKKVEDRIGLHPAFKKALVSLYGYTSDAEGIRHALMEQPTLDLEDARFMLVACSAFVNFIVSKASKAGLSLRR